jgi:phospholipase D1/2
MSEKAPRNKRKLIVLTASLLAVAVLCIVLWRFTSVAQLVDPVRLARQLDDLQGVWWAPFAFALAFPLLGLVVFPVTALSAMVAFIFPPPIAIATSFSGIMMSAALLHWLGTRFRKTVRDGLGSAVTRVESALSDHSIVTIAAIRMIPLAPFTLVNLVAGAIGVRFRDYMLGSALGLTPGMVMLSLFGKQAREFWHHPSVSGVLIGLGFAVLWLGMTLGLQRWAKKRNAGRKPGCHASAAARSH